MNVVDGDGPGEGDDPAAGEGLTEDDDRVEDELTVRAGAGLVADSDPTAEYEETERKMEGVLAAIDRIRADEPVAGGVER